MKDRAEFAVVWLVVTVIEFLPLSVARRFADGLAVVLRDWIGIRRDVVENNIQRAFPEWNDDQVENTTNRCYRFFARAGVDWIKSGSVIDQDQISIKIGDRLDQLADSGGILVSGHLGYWELAGVLVARRVDKLTVYADQQSNPYSQDYIESMRNRHDVHTVSGANGVRILAKKAQQGEVVAVVGDQRPRNQPAMVPFFGWEVKSSRILSFVARKSQKPVYPILCRRADDGSITFRLDPPLPSSNRRVTEENHDQLLREYNQWMEQRIRETPEQYFWFHKRWKDARPLDEGSTPV